MITIKPCPFCGGKAKVKKAPWARSEEGSSVCEVFCTECHANIYGETFNFYQVKYDRDNPQDEINAIEKWNKRIVDNMNYYDDPRYHTGRREGC